MKSATILGFPVLVQPAWLLVFALLIVSLVTSVAGTGPAALPGVAALGVSAGVVVLFVGSIVFHELSHAFVARRQGIQVDHIELLMLGRRPEPEAEPSSPSTEIIVAAAGPLASVLLGSLLLVMALGFPSDTSEPLSLVYWAVYWLGLANIVLALFHAVPVQPLDGGRIVRAVAWRVTGDLDRATGWASAIGRAFGYFVIGSGLFVAMFVEVFVGIWLILLGWFAGRLSRSAVDHRRMERLTAGLTVEAVIDREPAVIPPTLTVDTLIAQDEQEDGPGVYPVIDAGRLVGIVFLSRLGGLPRRDRTKQRAADVLVPVDRVATLRAGDPLMRAVEQLEAMRVDGLAVLEPGEPVRLAGLVTRRNLTARLRARQAILEARASSTSRSGRG